MLFIGLLPFAIGVILVIAAFLRSKVPFWVLFSISLALALVLTWDARDLVLGYRNPRGVGDGIALELLSLSTIGLLAGLVVRALVETYWKEIWSALLTAGVIAIIIPALIFFTSFGG